MENIEDLAIPTCQGLLKTTTILGISREAMILNVTTAICFVWAMKLWYMLPLFIVIHYLLFLACKKDPEVINIFCKFYIRQLDYYEEN